MKNDYDKDVTRPHFLAIAVVAALPVFAAVEVKQGTDKVEVTIDGLPFTTLHYGESTKKPFLAPLRAPSGVVVTRRWPMEDVAGETRDHPHHQGLWFNHGDVNGVNFWEHAGRNAPFGSIVTDKITTAKGGGKSGEIAFEARWVNHEGKALLRENRRMTFSGDANSRIIDVDITLTALEQPVKFGDTKEGSFGIRISDQLKEARGTGTMTNAAGGRKMKEVWGKPSPWVDYSGTIDGQPVGIAIFDHSKNPKHPTTWHSRDYGLFAANPFGDRDFYNDKTKDGSVTIDAGKSLRFRYRVVIHPGDADSAKVADLYKNWKQ
ncbi:MAG TPA: PmoA family protein [Bryobacteraceae bacterium]|nr:PmoA family protein [Bryobacteraceae bacterium]